MKILVDTNIVLDYLLEREPFALAARKIVKACQLKKIEGCIAAHTISNIFYILRKEYSASDRRNILKYICTLFEVEGLSRRMVISALDNEYFADFEDCLQVEYAIAISADYIVTRNVKDFDKSTIPVITPDDLLKMV